VTFFYFMSALGPGRTPAELSGTVIPVPTATREGIYREVRQALRDKIGCTDAELIVTSFTLEPNTLGA
jgi:hypothetical protein